MSESLATILSRIEDLAEEVGRDIKLMEVCGTHTHSIHRNGIDRALPSNLSLISGPGCPVCVTGTGYIDRAIAIAERHGAALHTFGDLVKVPGSAGRSLADARAAGTRVKVVSSAADSLRLASSTGLPTVFLGVGFETTAPGTASTLKRARSEGVDDFSVLSSMKLIPPAMSALASSPRLAIDGFLCPGHVSVVTGSRVYLPIAESSGTPCVVAGFEPGEILSGVSMLLGQISEGRAEVENAYPAVVSEDGNPRARKVMEEVLAPGDDAWRGLGTIPGSGLFLRGEYADHDARTLWPVDVPPAREDPECRCGDVLCGLIDPPGCSLFGRGCTPRNPRGACMVSGEGSCAAWFRYGGRRPE
ncbi:hydrogenase formation protein HypD [Candidatus Fermentibacteria bacterium]|nr:hydrogenase formation protein HypD [Candidatus Fermentibacteria bacterium]